MAYPRHIKASKHVFVVWSNFRLYDNCWQTVQLCNAFGKPIAVSTLAANAIHSRHTGTECIFGVLSANLHPPALEHPQQFYTVDWLCC